MNLLDLNKSANAASPGPMRDRAQKSSELSRDGEKSSLAFSGQQSGRGRSASSEAPLGPDPAILRLIRALARDAARQDHENDENK